MFDYLKLIFIREFYILKHYKIRLINILLFPIIIILENVFTGFFVKEIIFYNKYIPYFYFLIFSFIFFEIFEQTFNFILKVLTEKRKIYEWVFIGIPKYVIFRIIYTILNVYEYSLPIVALVFFFFAKNTIIFVISVLAASLISLPAIAFAFFTYPSIIKFRGRDVMFVRNVFRRFSPILIPATFSFYIFPKSDLLEILLPSVGIVEEIRKFAFLGTMNYKIFTLALLVNVLYLIIGGFIFYWVLEKSRREGWIGLD